jgi:hypothetical protein
LGVREPHTSARSGRCLTGVDGRIIDSDGRLHDISLRPAPSNPAATPRNRADRRPPPHADSRALVLLMP